MAAIVGTGVAMPHGVNASNLVVVSANVGTALIAADTYDLSLPSGLDKNMTPMSFRVLEPAIANVRLGNAQLTLTNHNVLTGVTRLTSAGAVPLNSTISVEYITTPGS